ncbi:hypothetical protein ASC87_26930 [Rhizobacter sp. Root1221]|nr:hypothetical protein ASC87_26930 [Rhizobacter sp. Root1221]
MQSHLLCIEGDQSVVVRLARRDFVFEARHSKAKLLRLPEVVWGTVNLEVLQRRAHADMLYQQVAVDDFPLS